MTTRANRIERYYDSHEIEGEEVSQSRLHYIIIRYLIAVLEGYLQGQLAGVISNVNFYLTDNALEQPKSPDIALLDGWQSDPYKQGQEPTNYTIGQDGLPPRLAFEISSEKTWRIDLENKPAQYATMGIEEYFVFDPNIPTLWKHQWRAKGRLVGWRRGADGQYIELEKDQNGRIWSEEVQSWLVVEGKLLVLYSAEGERRLTKEELDARQIAIEQQARRLSEQRAEAERQQRLAAEQIAQQERRQREAAEQAAERERHRAERLAELLRQNGYDPDKDL